MSAIAVIAGRGRLPQVLVNGLRDAGEDVHIVCFQGVDGVDWVTSGRMDARFEQPQDLFDRMHAASVDRVVFAGAMNRPPLDPKGFDATLMRYAPKILPALQQGDNAILSIVISMFADAGFSIQRPDGILPSLVAAPGVLTAVQPSEADRADADRAAQIVRALGDLDIGQGAVVAQGLCLATETLPGTDAMLAFVAQLDRTRLPKKTGAKGVVFKGPKPDQDQRIDLPAIGLDTVHMAAKAGLAGIAIAANSVLVIDKDAIVAAANDADLFIWSRPDDVT